MKAATPALQYAAVALAISIHAAREGGDCPFMRRCIVVGISIHAAREGGDPTWSNAIITSGISIHAAREGGDTAQTSSATSRSDFNPRRP